MKTLFKETQQFTQWWLWVLLIGIGLIPVIAIYKQLIKAEDFGNKPMSNFGLIIFAVFILLIIIFFRFLKLKTKITATEIDMNFFPLVSKKVTWENVKSAKVVDYGFVGGWGIRRCTSYGTVYNVKGRKGLAIELKNGTKFLIGTQKEITLKNVIREVALLN